ncbi:hypothetical protein [Candidatus Halobonum tyrrellensis]|nr:hypothetical protein [Candidatus Halobonum tyrrellensis]
MTDERLGSGVATAYFRHDIHVDLPLSEHFSEFRSRLSTIFESGGV